MYQSSKKCQTSFESNSVPAAKSSLELVKARCAVVEKCWRTDGVSQRENV